MSAKPTFNEISDERLRTMYVDQLMSSTAIGAELGVKAPVVLRRLRAAGVEPRPSGRRRASLDPDQLRTMYLDQEKPATEIAGLLGFDAATVRDHLRTAGVEIRLGASRRPLDIDASQLRTMYIDRQMSMAAIGAKLEVSQSVVRRNLDAAGIEIRRHSNPRLDLDVEQLRTMYVNQLMTVQAIATELGVSPKGVRRQLRAAGVAITPPLPKRPDLDPDALRTLYVDRLMSARAIGAQLGVGRRAIERRLVAAGVELRVFRGRKAEATEGGALEERLGQG